MGSHGQSDPPEPDIEPMLNASKYFLCHRNFDHCRKYAVKARETNPHHPGPAQLLAIAAVISVSPSATRPEQPECYSILDLPRFTRDPNLIRVRFDQLDNLLNPEKNPYPFAAEAHGWVFKAASILSNPSLKSQFDKDLRTKQHAAENDDATFWTVCPYCYFMYEYERILEECVLKCSNTKCRRAFTAVAVAASATPPPEVVEKGKYICDGFLPLGADNAKNCPEKGWKWWAPFMSMGSGSGSGPGTGPATGPVNENKEAIRAQEGTKIEKCDDFIQISDDEIAVKVEGEKKDDVSRKNGGNVVMKRKKMAAKAKKKVMGKGIKVKWNNGLTEDSGEGMGLKVDGNRDNAKASEEMEGCTGDGLEFSAREDDVYVALKSVTELGFEAFGA